MREPARDSAIFAEFANLDYANSLGVSVSFSELGNGPLVIDHADNAARR
jgi:hypothetical protein